MNYQPALVQLPLVKETRNELVRTPEDARRICEDITQLAQETFQVLSLNTRNMLICRHMSTLGIVNASLIHPREVFRTAIENSATSVVLIHNHCSGNLTPSLEDIKITKQLINAGNIIDIRVLDHVIVGKRS